jgi:translation initiation factor 6
MTFFKQINFRGDINIGLYSFATDSYCVSGVADNKILAGLKETLGVNVYNFHVLGIDFLKIFCTGNSYGIVFSKILSEEDRSSIRKIPVKSFLLKSDFAIGNMILMNDNGAVISPVIRKFEKDIKKFFGIKTAVSTIAGLNLVGSLGIATNKGCLVHPHITEKEAEIIESALDVKVDVGTVNFGSMFPGSGVVANSSGFVASRQTSGPELGRITETLGFL